MKKISALFLLSLIWISKPVKGQQFSGIGFPNGNVINCYTPTVTLLANSSFSSPASNYTWTLPNAQSVTGTAINAAVPGLYKLAFTNGTLFYTDSASVLINTITPSSALSPSFQTTNCNPNSITTVTLTALSPTINVAHHVISVNGGTLVSNSLVAGYQPFGSGTYTYNLVNTINGCSTQKVFNVASTQGYPTFSIQSSAVNFSLGCATTSVLTLNVLGANTSSPQGGAVSYSLLPPGSSTVLPSSGSLTGISSYSINLPGNYTVVVRDNSSLCETRVPVSVIQNTVAPTFTTNSGNNVLTCSNPSLLLSAFTSSANTVNWTIPGPTVTHVPNNSLIVNANFTVAPTNTLNGNYTLTVTNSTNLCASNTVISVAQNLFQPNAIISANPPVITCQTPTIVLVNQSTTGIPFNSTFPHNLPVIGKLWTAPAPQPSLSNSSTYTATTAGIYTMLAQDANNGCTKTTTISINDTRALPEVNEQGPFTILCPNGTVNIAPLVVTNTANLTYFWTIPPGATVNSLTNPVITISSPGTYTVTLTNTLTGCSKTATLSVWACVGLQKNTINKKILNLFPNPGHGNYTVELKEKAEVEIYNTLGEVILSISLKEGENNLNLTTIANGIYFLRINGSQSNETIRFIKD